LRRVGAPVAWVGVVRRRPPPPPTRLPPAALAGPPAGALPPAAALACAVCGGGNPANRFAFFASTIALSLLPLGMFAGAFLWLRARLRQRGGNEFAERDAAPAAPPPPPPRAVPLPSPAHPNRPT